MKIYQPMLYVGLGGTGCQIGIELERRLREELCGPDGRKLSKSLRDTGIAPLRGNGAAPDDISRMIGLDPV